MKIFKPLVFILAFSFLLLCGCGEAEKSTADTYIEMAQEFIENGDYDSAVTILQKGLDSTGDASLSKLLADTIAQQEALSQETVPEAPVSPYTSYSGIWSTEAIDWINGGMVLELAVEESTVSVQITNIQWAPACRVAFIENRFNLTDIKNQILVGKYDDDLWGNSGTYTLTFASDHIQCTFSDTALPEWGSTLWGFWDCTVTFTPNPDTYDALFYTEAEMLALYPDAYTQYGSDPTPDEPIYDMSTASGILAQAGLTEQEFRNICAYIGSPYYKNNAYVYAAGREYYALHPEENKHLDNRTNDWNNYQLYGKEPDYHSYDIKESSSLEEFLNRTIYGPKGASLLGKQSKEIFQRMQEYPADYCNQAFLLKDFRATHVYNNTYTDDCYILYDANISVVDYRDNVNYPNILQGKRYDMYVIFLGTNGSDNLVFALISVEKCE